ncbi:B3 domain-containing protein At3g25182-like [Rhododendron vialii]|uniref:B3 domain-containing protein At3g25182-like n=1 Tax=Rhododendron vialii TaxID=182163 RepID=UPI00265E2B75|nr:B3 domain-containing protein At3g25182-like [Rhododendron vialii]
MEEELSAYDSEVMESGYDYFKFEEVMKQSREYLLKLDTVKRLEIIKEVLKNPNFDDTDVYYLTMIEIQHPAYKPPPVVPKKPPPKIRFVVRGRQPTNPVREEEKAGEKTEKTGRKRPRGSSDWEFDEEEEKKRAIKKRANKKVNKSVEKKMNVDNVVLLPEIVPDLPDEFKERIRNLGGTKATLVIQKELEATDVSIDHKRLSLPWGKLKDKHFVCGEKKAFRQNGKGVPKMAVRLIAENGREHEIDIRQWNMAKGIYNVVKGWNDVVHDHGLCAKWIVQLWSFRVEGNLWFALVKL